MRTRQPILMACSLFLVWACGSTKIEPVKSGSEKLQGERCDVSECRAEVPLDAKVCPNGQSLGRTECVANAKGTCEWSFPACPQNEGGGTGGQGNISGDSGGGGNVHSCASGSVTFRVVKPAGLGETCIGKPDCSGEWLTILDAQGKQLTPGNDCIGNCDDCKQTGCPAICALPSKLGEEGKTKTWDGIYRVQSTCGTAAMTCAQSVCSQPGRYTARVCSFPNPDPSFPYGCGVQPKQEPTCVDVPFEYPSASDVVITLPGGSADAGVPNCEGGTATFVVTASPMDGGDAPWCLGAAGQCSATAWLTITDANGKTYDDNSFCKPGACGASCEQHYCPAICPLPPTITPAGISRVWNGTGLTVRGCGSENAQCTEKACALPGHYKAKVCGFERPAGVSYGCESVGHAEQRCWEQEFDYPSAAPIKFELPAPNP